MELVGTTPRDLAAYVARQVENIYPDGAAGVRDAVDGAVDRALERLAPCVQAAKMWPRGRFSYLHSNQNAVFLYFLANTLWRQKGDERLCEKLFYLNKTLNGFECFYTIELPDIFCVCHSPGIVLAQATYANYLVLYQNSTVGRVKPDERPVFGEGVVLFPNSAVVGRCRIGARTYVSQGSSIIDRDTPGDCVVFSRGGELVVKKPDEDHLARFFHFDG